MLRKSIRITSEAYSRVKGKWYDQKVVILNVHTFSMVA